MINTRKSRSPRSVIASLLFTIALVNCALAIGQTTQTPATQGTNEWWRHAVIYEVYPRSFQDSNGDGIGDLNGVISRLDYLKDLGIDAIWLSPIYPSPQVDFGYDITDYRGIDVQYGKLDDLDHLIAEAKKRGIGIIMDGVFNHTSDQHPWFQQSRSSKDSPKRDWYVWRDGKADGAPPNNWRSGFTHTSAWKLDSKTGQYYYHNFYAEQPDLNWRNPAVEEAVFDVMKFWMDRGVAGFRLDAVLLLFEDAAFRDGHVLPGRNPNGDNRVDNSMTNNLPELHPLLRRMRKLADSYPGHRVLIGEDYLPTPAKLLPLYGTNHDELHLPMDMQVGFIDKLDVAAFRKAINDAETQLDGNQPLLAFDNHDKPRSWDRYGDGIHNDAIARLIATLLLTTRSTATIYYGQELCMVTTDPLRREDSLDPIPVVAWPRNKGRDGERTPMQWDATSNAGFTTGKRSWLPPPPTYTTVNASTEHNQPESLLNWYKQLISLRKTNAPLRDGAYHLLLPSDPNVLAYTREINGSKVIVACNFSNQAQTVNLGQGSGQTLAASTPELSANESLTKVTLPPFASWVVEVR